MNSLKEVLVPICDSEQCSMVLKEYESKGYKLSSVITVGENKRYTFQKSNGRILLNG